MAELTLRTAHLDLVLESTEAVLARIEALSPADRAEVSPDWLARLRAAGAADPWTHGFAIVERASGEVVGSCAYKGAPGADGAVEIAYEVDLRYRRRGYATEAAQALADFALDRADVRFVCAHTLPADGASTRVLTKSGFTRVGEVVDPEDGLVWRWERGRG